MNRYPIAAMFRGLMLLLALTLASVAAGQQRTFTTAEGAVEALGAALKADNEAELVAIFGDRHKNLIDTGDAANDRARRAEAAAKLAQFHTLDDRGEGRRMLLIGPEVWPFPIPLVRQQDGAWRFATEEGATELLNRHIGGNERNAIDVLRAYLEAQRQYASVDRNGDGVLQYAQKLASTADKHDGLYWPADSSKGKEESPFGPLIAGSSAYLAGRKKGDPYRGYRFRILTRQSSNAAGGAYNYIINGRMIAGFAMIAYPDTYGETGVMTFIVNHNGKVYENDLGTDTVRRAEKFTAFDPGRGWRELAP